MLPNGTCALKEADTQNSDNIMFPKNNYDQVISEEISNNPPDRIYQSFSGKTIFLTGCTGFLGKVILERLLRLFDVKLIYILIRSKNEKSAKTRYNQLMASPLFDTVRRQKGSKIFEKCVPICGDVSMPNLDISPTERVKLQKEVEFVIHSAAAVRFDEPLRSAIATNTKGTHNMLVIAKKMENLQVFVHVSTAFSHPEEKILYEKIYPSPASPRMIMDLIDWMKDDALEKMTPSLLNNIPNTYVFSKALAEELVAVEMDKLPVILLRPSIVLPIWKDPLPGWTDNLNGPLGILVSAGKGVLRSMYGNKDIHVDVVAVDSVADAISALVANFLIKRHKRIFHLCSGKEVIVTWGDIIKLAKTVAIDHVPFDIILWKPGGRIRKSKTIHTLAVIFYHFLPALIVDAIVPCFGYKPFLWKIQKRISKALPMLEYYTNNEFSFNYDNSDNARNWLNSTEKAKYAVDPEGIDIVEYIITCTMSARRYILKEPDANLPRAKRNMKLMVWIDKISTLLLYVLLAYLIYKFVSYFL